MEFGFARHHITEIHSHRGECSQLPLNLAGRAIKKILWLVRYLNYFQTIPLEA